MSALCQKATYAVQQNNALCLKAERAGRCFPSEVVGHHYGALARALGVSTSRNDREKQQHKTKSIHAFSSPRLLAVDS
jgi:hypothetical protein